MKLIGFSCFVLIFSKLYIYILRVCFSDIFLPSNIFEIQFLFIVLTSILTIPLWFLYESTYQILKIKIFTESFKKLFTYCTDIILGFFLSDFLFWANCSIEFKSLLNQFIFVNVVHFIFCLFLILYFSKKNTKKLSNLINKLIEFQIRKPDTKEQTLNFHTINKLLSIEKKKKKYIYFALFKKNWTLNENNLFKIYEKVLKSKSDIQILELIVRLNSIRKILKDYFFIKYSPFNWVIKTFYKSINPSNKLKKLLNNNLINLNNFLTKTSYIPNEEIELNVIKKGRKYQQGIGYLEDGSLVFIENGQNAIGSRVRVKIKQIYQTPKGKLFFTKLLTIYN